MEQRIPGLVKDSRLEKEDCRTEKDREIRY